MNNPEDASYKKRTHISLDTNKWGWHPSPLVHQIVLVSTVSGDGEENVSPKSLVSMFSFQPPILAVGWNTDHQTARNILATQEFTVNIPHHGMAPVVWEAAEAPRPRSVESVGLTPLPGLRVRPPRIAECPAHLECVLDSVKAWGREVALFGEIVSYTRDEDIGDSWEEWYENLGPMVYLEDRLYGVVKARSL